MTIRRYAGLVLLLALPGLASAEIYRWVDAQGHVHYTQTPPPDSKAQKVTPQGVTPPADPGKGIAELEQALEESDRQRAAEAKKKEEASQQAQQRAVRCAQGQSRLKMLDERPPNRLMSKNEKGEYERWTTEHYEAERAKAMQVIQESCGG